MTSSLVGSEMCIRDRLCNMQDQEKALHAQLTLQHQGRFQPYHVPDSLPVSYTHLTLPTICSV
eukprot:5739801-Prorocentrum_lima.AAC.1